MNHAMGAVARCGIAFAAAVILGFALPGFRNPVALVLVVTLAVVYPWLQTPLAQWEWTHDPVTVTFLLVLLALALLLFLVSPSYLTRVF